MLFLYTLGRYNSYNDLSALGNTLLYSYITYISHYIDVFRFETLSNLESFNEPFINLVGGDLDKHEVHSCQMTL